MLALTTGDPAGIGSDIYLQLTDEVTSTSQLVVFGCRQTLTQRAKQLNLKFELPDYQAGIGESSLVDCPVATPVVAGTPAASNAQSVIDQLHGAHELASSNSDCGIVTCPVSKSNLAASVKEFRGHTEYFAKLVGGKPVVMAFIGPKFKTSLVTTHLPLAEVAAKVTASAVAQALVIANTGMQQLQKPVRWRVCGLNPHAGEQGLLGEEEQQQIIPGIELARQAGVDAYGPVSADTAFLDGDDCIMAMYHDQLLPVVKTADFANTVNVTFGLPYVRTSVDHGTAYQLAGSGKADSAPLQAAIRVANQLLAK